MRNHPWPAARADVLSAMPEEILLSILPCLDQQSRGRCACVSRQLQQVCESPLVWRSITMPLRALRAGSLTTVIQRRLKHAHALEIEAHGSSLGSSMQAEETSLLALCGSLTDAGAAELLNHAAELRALDLTGCSQLTAVTLDRLLRGCPHLENLRLRGCARITDSWVADDHPSLDESGQPVCAKLTILDVSHTQIDDDMMAWIVAAAPNLVRLEANFCSHVSDATLHTLGQLESLEHLAVLGCDQCTSPQLDRMEETLPKTPAPSHVRSACTTSRSDGETPRTGLLCDDSFISRRPEGMDASEAISILLHAYHAEEAFTGNIGSQLFRSM